jgi:glycosyltransferase involved in cell wall biosynthesis
VSNKVSARVGILYPADPDGFVPSGIDSYIRSVLKFAPRDIQFTVVGASSDLSLRPLGKARITSVGSTAVTHLPVAFSDPSAVRSKIPLTLRHIWGLRGQLRRGGLSNLDVLDFHRIEPLALFRDDTRPKNMIAHMNVENIRNRGSDIMWKYAPFLYDKLESMLIGQLDRVFTVQEVVARAYRGTYPRLAERVFYLPPMVDTSVFYPAVSADARAAARAELLTRLGVPTSSRVAVFVGRLDNSKDPLLLLDAFGRSLAKIPDMHLILIGDGNLRNVVEATCRAAPLIGRVSLLGALRSVEIAAVHRCAELFVLSSAYEGLPIAMLEALATGLPAVSTDVGDVRRVLQTGKNGVVCATRSAHDLAEAICLGMHSYESLSGAPCIESIASFRAERVLGALYENYRRQVRTATVVVGG